jgi:hypothetical protein
MSLRADGSVDLLLSASIISKALQVENLAGLPSLESVTLPTSQDKGALVVYYF